IGFLVKDCFAILAKPMKGHIEGHFVDPKAARQLLDYFVVQSVLGKYNDLTILELRSDQIETTTNCSSNHLQVRTIRCFLKPEMITSFSNMKDVTHAYVIHQFNRVSSDNHHSSVILLNDGQ